MRQRKETGRRRRGGLLAGAAIALPLAAMVAFALPAVRGSRGTVQETAGKRAPARFEVAESIDPDSIWDGLLGSYVHHGGVDYGGLAARKQELSSYLHDLAAVRPAELGEKERLAFWINAYNAAVVNLVLARYPGIQSVRKVDGFFDELKVEIAGRERTLDEIEAKARGFGDPRVHFALVCASASCPDLRAEAYRGSRLDAQLDDQVRTFLANPRKGLRFDRVSDTLYLSSIFKWYAGDFTGGSTIVAYFVRSGIVDWVVHYLPAGEAAAIRKADPSVSYMDYDWSLNDRPR